MPRKLSSDLVAPTKRSKSKVNHEDSKGVAEESSLLMSLKGRKSKATA